jgi:hypothetical protein
MTVINGGDEGSWVTSKGFILFIFSKCIKGVERLQLRSYDIQYPMEYPNVRFKLHVQALRNGSLVFVLTVLPSGHQGMNHFNALQLESSGVQDVRLKIKV